jgi:hypothetical protein
MQKYIKYISFILLILSSVVLILLEQKVYGWLLLGITTALLLFCDKNYRQDLLLVVISIGLLGITPINTSIGLLHFFTMGVIIFLAAAIPFFITRKIYKEKTIVYPFHHGRKWFKREILYIIITAAIAYLILPYYLRTTGAYHNWTVKPGIIPLLILFLGTNGLGTWDEFFFISTLLAIFKKHFSFPVANAAQAVIFTTFLYELGFRGWAPFLLYFFALAQGYIFKKTHSLLYVITIHLTLDLVLYLALIHAYYPQWIPFFIT